MSIRPISGNSPRTADQRQHERVYGKDRQLSIKSGKKEGKTSNWSQGGFLADGLDEYELNDQVEGTMEGPGQTRQRFAGKVVRVQDDGKRAVQLVSFDSSALLAMQSADDESNS
ncbi:MAG: hypothetical protein HOM52_03020 [Rhodospirillaceae bacterium]|jgi:hypothetical protein|nr:hypothetical protein [Rhodospirillaceae bacterium]MBT4426998.1 hypothetical protein [Rhodospirillaceae bacterium]MBT5037460.1 hypothetical protein [Rhodospirillaceae bacterium]MBT5674669.1 hypothetical protein [Rhodospirillaceae bacterium]MBT5779086.1 hypothetical protein [Rhodospirillaceae bacterium]